MLSAIKLSKQSVCVSAGQLCVSCLFVVNRFWGEAQVNLNIRNRPLPAEICGAGSKRQQAADLLMTKLLLHLNQENVLHGLAFKGGSMLRRMIFGWGFRFSNDLDFSVIQPKTENIPALIEKIVLALSGFAGVAGAACEELRIGSAAGGKTTVLNFDLRVGLSRPLPLKIEIDHRAPPILQPLAMPILFDDGVGRNESIPCLRLEEVVAEKIRACFQRVRVRDLYDLAAFTKSDAWNPEVVRSLTVLKLWQSPEHRMRFSAANLFGELQRRTALSEYDYDRVNFSRTMPPGKGVYIKDLVDIVVREYTFLRQLTPLERSLANDLNQMLLSDAQGMVKELGSLEIT